MHNLFQLNKVVAGLEELFKEFKEKGIIQALQDNEATLKALHEKVDLLMSGVSPDDVAQLREDVDNLQRRVLKLESPSVPVAAKPVGPSETKPKAPGKETKTGS